MSIEAVRVRVGLCCLAGVGLLAIAGCTSSGNPVAAPESTAPESATVAESSDQPAPTGTPVGTATMRVVGGSTPVTIRYRINGGPETTENNVTLPWSKDYPVYNQVSTSVSVTGVGATCTITMGSNLVSFKTDPHPTCEFAYYG